MSHTRVVGSKTSTGHFRRGGGQRQGNQRNQSNTSHGRNDFNAHQSSNFRTDCNSDNITNNNQNREDWTFMTNRGNRQRNRGQFKNKIIGRGTPKRSHSSSSSNASSGIERGINLLGEQYLSTQENAMFHTDLNVLPKHAKNPIFVGELMQRFNSILPSSKHLTSDEYVPVQGKTYNESLHNENLHKENQHNEDNPVHTFASISSSVGQGFRNIKKNSPSRGNTGYSGNRHNDSRLNSKFSDDNNQKFNSKSHIGNKREPGYGVNRHNDSRLNSKFSDDNYQRLISKSQTPNKKEQTSFSINSDRKLTGIPIDINRSPLSFVPSDAFNIVSESSLNNNRQNETLFGNTRKPYHESSAGTDKKQQETHFLTGVDKRDQILRAYGFKGKSGKDVSNTFEKNPMINQNRGSNQPSPGNMFFSQLEQFGSNCNSPKLRNEVGNTNSKTKNKHNSQSRTSTPNYEIPFNSTDSRSNSTLFELPKQIDNYNNFLSTQLRANPESSEKGHSSAQGLGNNPVVNKNASSNFSMSHSRPHYTGAVATNFNIQRPVNDVSERVLTRSEALQRIQDEYKIKQAEHEAKQKEKENKKREQYLMKYQHIDQGHRLAEGYLDEAAGYAPEISPFINPIEDVRQKQQEQIVQDALIFQELAREKNEQRKKKEEEKQKQWLNSHKHIDAGYKLGHKGNKGSEDDSKITSSAIKPIETIITAQKAETKEMKVKDNFSLQAESSVVQQESKSTQRSFAKEGIELLKPASIVLKNSTQGPILVLRCTEQALNKSLREHIKFMDEMDKLGNSTACKPVVEQAPVHSNNRFEMRPHEIAKVTGAIPKQKTTVSSSPAINCNSSAAIEPIQPECHVVSEPAIDYQAEMRIARLRMQQQYENALKEKQENS